MTTSERWVRAIDEACTEPDSARSNQLITGLHYDLSEAIAERLGREGGPNFHTWAVWGSRKAGATIRQEGLDGAIRSATVIAGAAGCVVGVVAGIFAGYLSGWGPGSLTVATGASIGTLMGGWSGRRIAIWARAKAARLILRGNRIVIQEIGEQSARFVELLEGGATSEGRKAFFAGLRPGPTGRHGQDRLAAAFRFYLEAFEASDLATRRAAMIAGNCEIVYHEHIRLEPSIRGAMPFILRRCVTRRWMTYRIGEKVLTVCEDLPGIPSPTAARNWASIDERMRYVFALFRGFHNAPEVFATPCPEMERQPSSVSGRSAA